MALQTSDVEIDMRYNERRLVNQALVSQFVFSLNDNIGGRSCLIKKEMEHSDLLPSHWLHLITVGRPGQLQLATGK